MEHGGSPDSAVRLLQVGRVALAVHERAFPHALPKRVAKLRLAVRITREAHSNVHVLLRSAGGQLCQPHIRQVELVGRCSREEYLRLFGRIDIALDPFPYNGDTTTCDGLWMGVPMVTLAGEAFVSRRGVSRV